MKVLKYIMIILGIIVGLFLIVALFLPATYTVERSLKIDQPVEKVYKTISSFSDRLKWDPWMEMDPDAIVTFTGPDSGVGASYTWDGEIVGQGKIVITEIIENEFVKSDLEFIVPFESKSKITWELTKIDSVTTNVSWSNTGNSDYPIGRYMGLTMDSMLGPDFEKGLNNLAEYFKGD